MYNRDNQYHHLNLDFYTANLTQIHTQNKKKEEKKKRGRVLFSLLDIKGNLTKKAKTL